MDGMDTVALDRLAASLRERLLTEVAADGAEAPAARMRALVDREAGLLDAEARDALVARIAESSFGLGPLEPLLRDPAVDEILVCGTEPVWVERAGRLEATSARFGSEAALRHVIERILAPLGRRADEAEPLCDARLPDGSRVNVVLPPLALDGPLLTIRRFRPRGFGPHDLVAQGTVTEPLLAFLGRAVAARCTVLICGGTGSGKTTTLGALASFADPAERIVTIEDAAELRLALPHVVRLEARPPNLEGRGEVTIRRLVRNALRMRPDRIIVGEVRGPEALDLLSALTTGHAGSLCTIHAGSAAEALRRLETLALMADVGLPLAAIREQVADAIDLVVCQARGSDGTRRIVEVAEVVRTAGGPGVRELFSLRGGRAAWRPPAAGGIAERPAATASREAPARSDDSPRPSRRAAAAEPASSARSDDGSVDRPAGSSGADAGLPDAARGEDAAPSFLPPAPPRS
jgi:pilus assembly protein CpaF